MQDPLSPYKSNLVQFSYKDSIYKIIELEVPANSKYFIMESLNQVKDNNNFKSIHVIELLEEDQKILMVSLLRRGEAMIVM